MGCNSTCKRDFTSDIHADKYKRNEKSFSSVKLLVHVVSVSILTVFTENLIYQESYRYYMCFIYAIIYLILLCKIPLLEERSFQSRFPGTL